MLLKSHSCPRSLLTQVWQRAQRLHRQGIVFLNYLQDHNASLVLHALMQSEELQVSKAQAGVLPAGSCQGIYLVQEYQA